jgi:uncharacterized surface protein with fasciclin (FAS1) repeats
MRTRTRTIARTAALAAAAGLTLLVTACGGSSDTGSAAGSTTTSPSTSSSSAAAAGMGDTFGAACAQVPSSGKGSFDGMAADPVATAASNNPLLSTLVSAVGAAGLGDTLNGAQGITVFAPVNDAFMKAPKATVDKALADPKGLLTKVLTYHVVPGMLTPQTLAGSHKTLEGGTLMVDGSGTDFTVNGNAKVVCGNVKTANATVYLIDGLLLPTA